MFEESRSGYGIFMWNSPERRSNRYGYFFLAADTYSGSVTVVPDLDDLAPLVGKRVEISCRVLDDRDSGHTGDIALGITPSRPGLFEVIELGVGVLDFKSESKEIGLRPGDGRSEFWIDPRILYRLHDQTVTLLIQTTEAAFTAAPKLKTPAVSVISHGDGTFQYKGVEPADTDKLLPRITPLGDDAFLVNHNYRVGDWVKLVRSPKREI